MKRYLTAEEAADLLGVSKATLYAYVSRGLIRSEALDGQSRARRYLSEDVRKLQERKDYRRDPAQVAQEALHWGMPLLDSALTLISDDALYYRGYDVRMLAESKSIEEVAALLWTGIDEGADWLFEQRTPSIDDDAPVEHFDFELTPIQRITVALTIASGDDLAAYNLDPEAVVETGARILRLTAEALTMQRFRGGRLAQHLQRSWRPDEPNVDELIDAALILCADHELNVSSFAARVVASAEATPYAVVMAGLAALQGVKHGGISERVEAFLREMSASASNQTDRAERIAVVTAERLRRGERIPGFGHSLYPEGDPRAETLLALLQEANPDAPEVRFVLETADTVTQRIGQYPNIDFALAALAYALHLPPGAPLMLFALGRTVGWIGHAIEQYQAGVLIRPRARYVGNPPVKG